MRVAVVRRSPNYTHLPLAPLLRPLNLSPWIGSLLVTFSCSL